MKLPAISSSRHVRQMSLFPSKMKTILLDPSEFHVVPGSLGTQVSMSEPQSSPKRNHTQWFSFGFASLIISLFSMLQTQSWSAGIIKEIIQWLKVEVESSG